MRVVAFEPMSVSAAEGSTVSGTVYSKDEGKETIVIVTDAFGFKNQPVMIDLSDFSKLVQAVGVGQSMSLDILARESDTYLRMTRRRHYGAVFMRDTRAHEPHDVGCQHCPAYLRARSILGGPRSLRRWRHGSPGRCLTYGRRSQPVRWSRRALAAPETRCRDAAWPAGRAGAGRRRPPILRRPDEVAWRACYYLGTPADEDHRYFELGITAHLDPDGQLVGFGVDNGVDFMGLHDISRYGLERGLEYMRQQRPRVRTYESPLYDHALKPFKP
jgi:hypothetical protein